MQLYVWRLHGLFILVGLLLSISIKAQSLRILPNLGKEKIPESELADYLTRITGQEGMTFDILRENKQQDGNYIQFQQYYRKVPVDAARITAQVKNGVLQKLVGKWVDEPLAIDVNAHLMESQAIEKGKAYAGFGQFRWEDPVAESSLKALRKDNGATYYPYPTLMITKGGQQENPYKLAYVMDIAGLESMESYKVVLDAQTGELIYKTSNHYNCNSIGTATSDNLGAYSVLTDDTGSGFRLLGCQGNTDIHTMRFGGLNVGNPFGALTEYIDADNDWTSTNPLDQSLTDVHFGMMLSNKFFTSLNVNPFDGEELLSVVNVPQANARYWLPPVHAFTFGIAPNGNTMTCLDVVAHEYTHAVSQELVGWNNAGETAAINESISDIFGNIIQGTHSGHDWELGECMDHAPFQGSMSSPNDYSWADTYGGLYWAQGGQDQKSGVGNFWFYLLTNGGVGTNDNNDDYEVDGIGLTDAERLIWHTLLNYIGPNVTFEELRALTLQSATDLWGACSLQYISCMNAWHAVGVGIPYIGGAPQNLVADPVGVCLATLCFENTGYESYLVNYWPINTQDYTTVSQIVSTDPVICITVDVLPHVQYVWEVQARCGDFVEVSPEATFTTNDVCGSVTNLEVSDVTYCGALVTWDFPIAHHFLVEVAPTATMNFGLIPPIITTNNSAQLTGLDPNTQYVVRVTVFCCVDVEGAAVYSDRFTTLDLECTIPPFEVITSACRIFIKFTAQPNQLYSVGFPNGGTSWLPSSGLTFSVAPETEITFRLRVRCGNGSCFSDIFSDWITVTTPALEACEPPTNLTATPGAGLPGVLFSWEAGNGATSFLVRTRTNPTGNFNQATVTGSYFYVNNWSNYFEICVTSICNCDGDPNVEMSEEVCLIYTVEDCEPPATYSHQILCPDQVLLFWGHVVNRDRYFVEYSTNGVNWVNALPTPYLGNNAAILNGLSPDTHYFWRVRTRCQGGALSDWGTIQEFDTPPVCQEVSNVSATVSGDEVSITWAPSPINDYTTSFYEIRYRLVGSANWNSPPIIVDETSFVRNLPCGAYEFQVRAHCGNCGASDWSDLDTFTIVCEGGCGNGLHIAEDPTALCDPCKEHSGCYVCIFDANGNLISQVENIYEIDWTVPPGYPIPAGQLTNGQCIPMSYDFDGETFTATIRLYDIVNGYKTLRCETVLHYTHDCGEGDGHDGGGGTFGGGLPASPSGGNPDGDSNHAFRVFPNPAANILSIASAAIYPARAEVYDALGHRIREIPLRPGEILQVDVSEWPAGMYFIKIADETGKQTTHQSVVIAR